MGKWTHSLSWLLPWLSQGLPAGTFHLDLLALTQYVSFCWLRLSASSFWFPFVFSHPQAERSLLGQTCFKETKAGIAGAQSSHYFNPPRGGAEPPLSLTQPSLLLPEASLMSPSRFGSSGSSRLPVPKL